MEVTHAVVPPQSLETPAILDLEASGFGRHSYPIEVGFVLPDGSSYCTLIQPAAHWTHWDHKAEAVHGIARDTLLHHGRDIHAVARLLNEHLQGRTLFCDGWGHDYPWLAKLYEEAGVVPNFRLDNLYRLLTENEACEWHTIKTQVSKELCLPRHRASSDARVLQLTFLRVRGQTELANDSHAQIGKA